MSNEINYNFENLSDIDVSTEEEFVDLKFSITNYSQEKDSTHIITGHGLYKDKIVGLKLSVKPAMFSGVKSNGEIDNSLFYPGGIKIYSIGKESDEFINALKDLFKTENDLNKMVDVAETLTFILALNTNSIKVAEIKSKVFFDSDNKKDSYSEWYVNINLPKKEFQLREKDAEFRPSIISSLVN